MSDYQSNLSLTDAARLIQPAQRVLITTHAKPDGDAYGAVAAMTAALRTLKPQAAIDGVLMGPVLPSFRRLRGYGLLREHATGMDFGKPDLVLILDTGAWAQVAPMRSALEPLLDRTLIVDHHLTGDIPAKHRVVDGAAAAVCCVIVDLLDAMVGSGVATSSRHAGDETNPLIRDVCIAESLFAGVASDTGWFRFSNTSARTHLLAARLMKSGIDQADLYAKLEQNERLEKLALQVRAMQSMKLLANGQAAVMILRAKDFAETGAHVEETERFVDIPQSVSAVQVVALVVEPPPAFGNGTESQKLRAPVIRVSLRSKPGADAINVAELAARFGGGGHARAAGVKFTGTLEQAVATVEEAILGALRG